MADTPVCDCLLGAVASCGTSDVDGDGKNAVFYLINNGAAGWAAVGGEGGQY